MRKNIKMIFLTFMKGILKHLGKIP